MSCTRRIRARIRPFVDSAVSSLTTVARAVYDTWPVQLLSSGVRKIYETEPVQHAHQGFGQIARVPGFLSDKNQSAQTRIVLLEAFLTNIGKYLVPVAMYRRAINIFHEDAPDVLDPVIVAADCLMVATLVVRLFARRFVDNTLYSACLTRAISNDHARYLSQTITEDLAVLLARIFSDTFSQHNISRKIYPFFVEKFHKIFTELFAQKNISQASIRPLRKKLEDIFLQAIAKIELTKVDTKIAADFAKELSKAVAEEFLMPIITASLESTAEYHRENLKKILSRVFMNKDADGLSREMVRGINDTRVKVQSFLPIKNFAPCGCEFKKTAHATLSSPIYYTGLVAATYIPNLVEAALAEVGLVFSKMVYLKGISWLFRALINGQSLIEAKLSSAGQCTRHRYEVGSSNKARLFGEGAAYLINIELMAAAGRFIFEVDNFFTRDAIASFALLLHVIPTLAFNEPLPGKMKWPLDVFLPGRKLIFMGATALKNWMAYDLNDKAQREQCIRNIKDRIGSKKFHAAINLILGKSEFIPTKEWGMLKEQQILAALNSNPPSKELVRLNKKLDPARTALAYPALRLFFRFYQNDIDKTVHQAEFLRTASTWLARPLSAVPLQGGIVSMLEMPVQLLNEDALDEIFRKIHEEVCRAQFLSSTMGIQESNKRYIQIPDSAAEKVAFTIAPYDEHLEQKTSPFNAPITAAKLRIMPPLEETLEGAIQAAIRIPDGLFVDALVGASADAEIVGPIGASVVSPRPTPAQPSVPAEPELILRKEDILRQLEAQVPEIKPEIIRVEDDSKVIKLEAKRPGSTAVINSVLIFPPAMPVADNPQGRAMPPIIVSKRRNPSPQIIDDYVATTPGKDDWQMRSHKPVAPKASNLIVEVPTELFHNGLWAANAAKKKIMRQFFHSHKSKNETDKMVELKSYR